MTKAMLVMSNRGGGEELEHDATEGNHGASMLESTLRNEMNTIDTRTRRNDAGTLASNKV